MSAVFANIVTKPLQHMKNKQKAAKKNVEDGGQEI